MGSHGGFLGRDVFGESRGGTDRPHIVFCATTAAVFLPIWQLSICNEVEPPVRTLKQMINHSAESRHNLYPESQVCCVTVTTDPECSL